MAKAVLVAPATPSDIAARRYVPAVVIRPLEKVATPPTAVAFASTAPPVGPSATERNTVPVKLVIVAPWPFTAAILNAPMVAPAVVEGGCVWNSRRAEAAGIGTRTSGADSAFAPYACHAVESPAGVTTRACQWYAVWSARPVTPT